MGCKDGGNESDKTKESWQGRDGKDHKEVEELGMGRIGRELKERDGKERSEEWEGS